MISEFLYAVNIERIIISSMINCQENLEQAFKMLSEEYFYNNTNKKIFKEIKILYESKSPIDIIILSEQDVDADYLSEICENIPSTTNIKKYCEILIEKHLRRKLIDDCLKIQSLSNDESIPIENIVERTEDFTFGINTTYQRLNNTKNNDIKTMYDAAEKWKEYINKTKETNFYYDSLNKTMRCFSEGEVFYIAARGGTGKTTLLMHIIKNISDRSNGRALFFSLEMQSSKIFYRASVIEMSRINGYCDIDTVNRIINNDSEVENICDKWKNILIVDHERMTVDALDRYMDKSRELYGEISVVGIDYLGYLKDTRPGSNYEQVSRIAKDIKGFAKRQSVRCVVACQTSREGEDGYVPVKLNHMRDSGTIEESADYVLGMWKDAQYQDRLHCKILKNRNGEEGLEFDFIKSGLMYKEADDIIKSENSSTKPKSRGPVYAE